jgi:hypothetical protein
MNMLTSKFASVAIKAPEKDASGAMLAMGAANSGITRLTGCKIQ